MRRLVVTSATFALGLLLMAPAVLAADPDHGEGTYGPVTDKNITNVAFMVIIFFPLLCLVLTLIQWKLDSRKERRKKAAKKLASDWHGGW